MRQESFLHCKVCCTARLGLQHPAAAPQEATRAGGVEVRLEVLSSGTG